MYQGFRQNLAYLIVAAVVFVTLLLLQPAVKFAARGLFLPAPGVKSYQPVTKTKLYASFPVNYTVIGNISMMLHAQDVRANSKKERRLVSAALNMAADHGGSGLVLQQLYYVSPKEIGSALAGYTLTGVVIRTGSGL